MPKRTCSNDGSDRKHGARVAVDNCCFGIRQLMCHGSLIGPGGRVTANQSLTYKHPRSAMQATHHSTLTPPASHCPICGLPAASSAVHLRNGIPEATYVCLDERHAWNLRWCDTTPKEDAKP